ncbi:MAG TPA: Spy/CpxP family protein refolding chaperone [Noviherbaspirillum sp.]
MRTTTLAALATALVLSVSAHAQPGGYGMGPGMMGGYGMGPGMMGGPGVGHGMMGFGPGWIASLPDLTREQRDKIAGIQKELRQKQWPLMEKMHDEFDAQNPYRGGKFDEQAARKGYETVEKLHRQMFENMLDAQKRIDGVLTPQQREQLQRAWGR